MGVAFSPFDEEVAAAWHNQMIGSTASEKHTGSGKDGRKESTVVNQKRKHKKDEDADRAHFWGATRSVGVSGNWDDPDAGVDEEDRRLEALEIEARAIASKQAEAGQSAPENASVKNDARVMKGCTSGEMARIVYSNRERAEKLAQIAQMRLQMAHDIAQLEVGAQRLRRAKLMMLAKRMALQELIDGLRRRAGEDDEDEENADGSDHRGSDNCDDRRKDEKEHGQEDGECSGPIVSPKTQVLQLKGVTRHEAKMILQHMQKSLSEADLEVDGAPKASHSGSTMSGPSTSSRVLHPLAPGLLPAWNETPRGVRKEPSRKSSSGQSSSPGVAASSSRSFSG